MTDPQGPVAIRDRIVRLERVKAGQLEPHPQNWRRHPPAQAAAMRAGLEEIGFAGAVIVRPIGDGRYQIIDGHLRSELDPDAELPVLVTDLDEAEALKLLATYDPIGAMAIGDGAALTELLEDLDFEMPELGGMLDGVLDDIARIDAAAEDGAGDGSTESVAPEPPDDPVTQPGDLYVLGKHRLLCGDSSLAPDVDRLVDGAPIHMVNTDPPYNVQVEPRSNSAIAAGNSSFPATKTKRQPRQLQAKDRPVQNDNLSDEAFADRLLAWFGNASRSLRRGGAFYIWGGYGNCANYPAALSASGLYFSQSIIWVKEHPVIGRKDFMGNHEWCFYGWREGAAHRWFGPLNIPDVWSVKKVSSQSMVHLTEKPVELARRAIQYSSRPGENVLDLFGGSGSTMIAAEQSDRHAFLMEIDPAYCDVIVQRSEEFTGEKAERIPAPAKEKAPAEAEATGATS